MNHDPSGSILRRISPFRALVLLALAMGRLGWLWVVLAMQILISSAYILYFCKTFRLTNALILVHLPLATGLFAASVFIPAALLLNRRIRKHTSAGYALALIPGFTLAFLTVLYLADFASYGRLGANLNYDLAWAFFSKLITGDQLIRLSLTVYLTAAAIVVIIVAVNLVLAPKAFAAVRTLIFPERDLNLRRNRRRIIAAAATSVFILLSYGIYLYILKQRTPYSELLSADPLLSFIRTTVGYYDEDYPVFVSNLRASEARCRAAYPHDQTFEKRNVILIIVDSLRADHTQLYGYSRPTTPFLNSLFAAGHLRKVEFATATCSETSCGILSILFSKRLRSQIPESFKLHELLRDQGYKTYFILSGSHGDWENLRRHYGSELDFYFDGDDSKQYGSGDDRLIFEGLAQLPNYANSPAFFYFHLMSPHLIGVKQDAYRMFQPSDVKNNWETLLTGVYDRNTIINNYDNGVLQADAMIKGLFQRLTEKGYLQNSIVAISADHGEALGERGKYGHGRWLYQPLIRIPLLIYDESPTTYSNQQFATQIDIAPTIVDRLHLKIPDCWQGVSLLDPNIPSLSIHRTLLRNPCYALIHRTETALYKYMYCSLGKTEELYDLTHDPNEQTNLMSTANAALIQSLRAESQRSQSY